MDVAVETTRWKLDELLAEPVEESLEAALAELEARVAAFEAGREHLSDDIDDDAFLEMVRQQEVVADLAGRLSAYGALWFTEDTQNRAALNLQGRLAETLTAMQNRMLFFNLWFKDLSDETAARLIAACPDYRYYLERERAFRPHTLSESEEQIINLKDANGIEAMMGLWDMITNRFTFELEIAGDTQTLTRDEMVGYFRHPDPAVRAATYQELFRVYEENSTLLAQIYNHRARDWRNETQLRDFEQPISYRNLANDLPDDVVDTLLDVCRRNSTVFQRYFKLKAGWLGVDKLRRYDIYAPLATADKTFPYGAAVETVLDSFDSFSPEVARLAQRVFDEQHIDSQVRHGKRGGAFCYSATPELTPWVMVNYSGKARDVGTLAHELGHAIHGMLASDNSPLNFHATLPLAETASTFSELVLTNRLLAQESDPAVKRDILAAAIDDAYATVQRQSYFTMFEREAHRLIAGGATVDEVSEAYMDNLRDQFGDALELSDDFRLEWVSIPHFYHVPFYTYAYSFGQLLVLALYRRYQEEGQSFIPGYVKLLSYGGSEAPVTALEEAGVDIASPAFWQGGYDVLSDMISELESL